MDYRLQHKIKQAKEYEAQGKFLHAIQIYRSLIDDYPDYAESYISLAELYNMYGKKESAEKIFNQITEKQPDNLDVKTYFAEFLIKNEEWQKAVDMLSGFSSEDDPFISYLIGYSYFKMGNFELAKVFLLNFVITDEDPELIHNAYYFIARSDFELKQYEPALKFAKKAEVLFSDNWQLMLLLAKIYYRLDMFMHSADWIRKAIGLNNKEPELYHWAGKIYLKTGDFKKAKDYFAEYIDLKEEISSNDYTFLAHACLKAGKLKEALDYYNTALKLDPENKSAIEGKEKTSSLLNNNMASDA